MEAIRVPSGGLENELDLIKRCAGEDIHGFLRAKPPLRRESLSRFSWMLPLTVGEVMDGFGLPTPFRVVQHTRNVREIPEGAPDEVRQAQMPYPRSYSSGIYGLVSSLDLVHIGHSFTGQKDLDKPARLKRRKLAVQSYVPLLTGSGASLARALPISELLEVITIISEKPIPTPIHPIYPGYYEDNIALYRGVSKALACKATMYVWSKERSVQSTGDGAFKLEETKEPAEPFHKIIEEWMKS
jgi:CRISPR-associated autoregulator DevR family